MRVGVVGNGLVGHATGEALRGKGKHEVKYFDVDVTRTDFGSIGELVGWAEAIVSAVPTNNDEAGKLDDRGVRKVVEEVAESRGERTRVFVQRSTVTPGWSRKMAPVLGKVLFVYCPSFLYRATALKNEEDPEKVVAGLGRKEDAGIVFDLWNWVPEERFFFGGYEEAELAKYVSNNMQSVILSFLNEVYVMAKEVGADPKWIIETMVAEKSLGCLYRVVGKAYGPGRMRDDLSALLAWVRERGLWMVMQQAAQVTNTMMECRFGVESRSTKELLRERDFRKVSKSLEG